MSNTIVATDLRKRYGDVRAVDGVSLTVETGEFGAMMNVSSVNDGPVTILFDTESL